MKHLFISVIALAILYGYSVYSYAGNQQNSANSGNVTSVVLYEFAIEEDTTPTPNPDQPKEDDTEGTPDPDQPKEDDTEGTPDPDQPKEDDTEGMPCGWECNLEGDFRDIKRRRTNLYSLFGRTSTCRAITHSNGYNVPARHEDVIQYLLTGNADPIFGQNWGMPCPQ